MGRKNKEYAKSLQEQAYSIFQSKLAFGESKKDAIKDGTSNSKIFSIATYKTYWKHTKYFLSWVKEVHPSCTTLRKAKEYVPEWLQYRTEQGLSAWTVSVEKCALHKLYGDIKELDLFKPPERHRADIVRSRGDCVTDRHFSEKNNMELINFCKGTGLRRHELTALKGADLLERKDIVEILFKLEKITAENRTERENTMISICKDALRFDKKYYVYVRSGKGGRARISPIIGPHADKIVERMKNTPAEEKVWWHIHTHADVHSFRSFYAVEIYRSTSRKICDIPFDKVNKGTGHRYQSQVYICRRDEYGRRFDRNAMFLTSKALGHNRLDVVANNYLRNL